VSVLVRVWVAAVGRWTATVWRRGSTMLTNGVPAASQASTFSAISV
jgi:hypothetical protein